MYHKYQNKNLSRNQLIFCVFKQINKVLQSLVLIDHTSALSLMFILFSLGSLKSS